MQQLRAESIGVKVFTPRFKPPADALPCLVNMPIVDVAPCLIVIVKHCQPVGVASPCLIVKGEYLFAPCLDVLAVEPCQDELDCRQPLLAVDEPPALIVGVSFEHQRLEAVPPLVVFARAETVDVVQQISDLRLTPAVAPLILGDVEPLAGQTAHRAERVIMSCVVFHNNICLMCHPYIPVTAAVARRPTDYHAAKQVPSCANAKHSRKVFHQMRRKSCTVPAAPGAVNIGINSLLPPPNIK